MTGKPTCPDCGKPLESSDSGCPACLLNLALATSSGGEGDAPQAGPERLAEDSRVGPYRIVRELGEGGMGVVYLAEQTEPIKRRVALKVIKRGMDTEQVVRRFEAERQALALMDHAAIARVHEAGETPAGRPYFAMEYIEGEPVTEYCERKGLGVVDRLTLFSSICEGVQHAHRRGIIHRDLKPSNILVTETDGEAQPKIIDFGVAKATEQSLTDRSALTAMGVLLGTPEYMSPEQADLSPFDVDTRTDVYSLGVVLYELVTGTLPFDRRLLERTTFDEIRRQVREVRPSKPSSHRRLPGELDLIVMKALEKDRDRRYGSPSELADDIRRHLSDEPVLARPTSALYQLRKLAARNRLATGLLALLVVLAIVGTAVNVNQTRKTRAERDRATLEAETARNVSSFLEELFAVADPRIARGIDITVRDVLDQGAQRIETELTDQPEIQTRLLVLVASIYNSLGVSDEALRLLERSHEVGADVLADQPELDVERLRSVGWIHRDAGRLDDALAYAEQAHARAQQALDPAAPLVADTLMLLGVVHRDRGDLDDAREFLHRALALARQHQGEESVSAGWTLFHLGWLDHRLGRGEEASASYDVGCAILERTLKANNPGVASCLNDHATILQSLQEFDAAAEKLSRAIEIWEQVLPPGHPRLAEAISNLGNQAYFQLDYATAEQHYLRALSIREQALGSRHPDFGAALCNLGLAYRNMLRFDEAEKHFLRGIAIMEEALGSDNVGVVSNRFGLATLYEYQGRFEEALALHEMAITARERTHGADHLWTAGALRAAAVARVRLGRYDEAIAELERATKISAAGFPPENAGRRKMEMDLANAYQRAGRDSRASDVAREVVATSEAAALRDEAAALAHYVLARLAWSAGARDEVDASLQRAIEVRSGFQPEDHPQLLYVRAVALAQRGEADRALEALGESLERGYLLRDIDLEIDLAPLRGDERLEPLLARASLPLSEKR
jgi:tetratricopeptide (TPR) repeat protein/tRNA A-37 threonylcarbamoyl transferase component Bud32